MDEYVVIVAVGKKEKGTQYVDPQYFMAIFYYKKLGIDRV